jgi:hypothetical protein
VCSMSESVERGGGLGGELSMEDGALVCDCARLSESILQREGGEERAGKREREREGGEATVESSVVDEGGELYRPRNGNLGSASWSFSSWFLL